MRAAVRRIARGLARLDDSWVGDLIGGLCLAFTAYLLFFFAGVLS